MSERTECSFKWSAPYLHENGKVTRVRQECSLPTGHEGDHMSWTKVTAPNTPGYTWDPGTPIHPKAQP